MSIEKAIEILKHNYERALKIEYIHNPLAWALYKTWRFVDSKAKKTEGVEK